MGDSRIVCKGKKCEKRISKYQAKNNNGYCRPCAAANHRKKKRGK